MRGAEPERAEGALAARGMADAAAILARHFSVAGDQCPIPRPWPAQSALADHLKARFDMPKADLATAMLTRMRALAAPGGTVASVTPQNWLFLGSYKKMREALLAQASLALVAVLGEHGFESSAGGVYGPCGAHRNTARRRAWCSPALTPTTPTTRLARLRSCAAAMCGCCIRESSREIRMLVLLPRGRIIGNCFLVNYADSWQGLVTGDDQSLHQYNFGRLANFGNDVEILYFEPCKGTRTTRGREHLVLLGECAGCAATHNADGLTTSRRRLLWQTRRSRCHK